MFHQCELERYHFGRHLCWCGWAFGQPEDHDYQGLLPLVEGMA